ncbi:unnamed protein product [Lactuca saligna]|uniref:Uncharacterized protein n=1 Tax=Lactuca saligna TaxID=75948 RepID=A0AA35VWP7_LACSI|nr:unnamed protein product [Lactuca saligna]
MDAVKGRAATINGNDRQLYNALQGNLEGKQAQRWWKNLLGFQNLFLYRYGVVFNFLGMLGTAIIKGPESFDILQGHSKATMLLIVNNTTQGMDLNNGIALWLVAGGDGWGGLNKEMKLDMHRIWNKNLGKYDICIADNGKEARFSFLVENVIRILLDIPLWKIADLGQPSGVGDKKILREV